MNLSFAKCPLRFMRRFLLMMISIALLSACGQGEGPQPIAGTPQPPLVGVLVDSPVSGVDYRTTGGTTGTTNASGEFSYLPSESVTFSIGGITLGTVPGSPFVTVVELTNSVNPTSTAATNMLIFLQSLDADSDPSNGIQIAASASANATGLSLDFTAADFASLVANAISAIAGAGKQIVSTADALNHFYTTYVSLNGTDTFTWLFPGYPPVGSGNDTYELVFADEFDSGTMPNPANWSMETGYGPDNFGWGNNEWQLYTADSENVRVEDGNLVISALCDAAECGVRDGTITSGRINSLNKFEFKFGKVVARIKPPVGTGAWPAFWALGANFPDIGWPRAGEIDFMEMHNAFSNDRTTHSTMHWCDDSVQAPATCSFPDGWRYDTQNRSFPNSLGDGFHIWEADWNADRILVSLDGVPYFSKDIDPDTMEEFLEEFFLILNVAMGGTLGSDNQPPSGDEVFPQTMLVDYVRVFQNSGGSSSGPEGFVIDFEDAADSYDFGLSGGFGGGAAAVIPNPVSMGINTSTQVGRMLKFQGEVFAGSQLAMPVPIQVTSGSTFTMKVWSPREVPVLFKLEGDTEAERSVTHTGSGWEELTFDFGSYAGSADFITLIFDLGVVGDATGDPDNWTFYFDDITFIPSNGGTPPVADTFELDFEDAPETYNFGIEGGFGGGAAAVITNPVSTGINTSAQVARMLKFSGEVFAGSLLELPVPLNVSAGSSFTMKVWSPREVMVLFKLEGAVESEVNLMHGGSGWEEMTFNFGSYSGSVEGLTFIFDLGIVGDATGDPNNWTFYFDDITLIPPDDGGGDPDPIDPANLDFEGATGDYDFGTEGGFGGGAAAVVSNPVSEGINTSAQVVRMLKFAGEVFAGTKLFLSTALDVAAGSSYTMKVWSPRPVMVLLKLEGATEIELNVQHGGTGWEELAYDFTSFSGSVEGYTVIFDLGTAGDAGGDPDNWTFYFDDITLVPPGQGPPPPVLDQIDLPITFDDDMVDYTVIDFGQPVAAMTSVIADPEDAMNMVASTTKPLGTPVWAGTTMSTTDGLATPIPFTASVTTIGLRVWSADAGVPVRLKAEDMVGGNASVEVEVMTTVANEWETLVFDFASEVPGTLALDPNTTYTALSVFFNFGTDGDTAGQKTYLWDDVEFGVEPIGDVTPPILTAVSLLSNNANPTLAKAGDVVTVSLTADEPLMTPVVMIGGAVADNVTGADAIWQATRTLVAGDVEGTVAFSIAYSDLADNAGVAVTATTDSTAVLYDTTMPGLVISGAPTFANTLDPFTLTFQFDEAVSGFEQSDIVVTNGMASTVTAIDAETFTAAITPTGDGSVTVNVATNAASDAAGNLSTSATEVSLLIDITPPTVTILGAPASFDSLGAFSVTFQFSEMVTGFIAGDVQVSNGSSGSFVAIDEDTYTSNITPNGNGDLTLSVAAGVAQDGVGNGNLPAAGVTVTNNLDADAPLLTAITIVSNNVNSAYAKVGDEITIGMTANENISMPTVMVNGSPADAVLGTATTWSAVRTFTALDTEGPVTFTIDYQDIGGNAGPQATVTTDATAVTFDATIPVLTIGGLPTSLMTTDPIALTFQFSEEVTGFDSVDVVVTNGTAAAFTTVDALNYTATVTPTGGDIIVTVAAGLAFDVAGNSNTQTSVSATVDLSPFWQLAWSDEFDGASLDTNNWTVRTDADCPAPCDGIQSYSAGNVSVASGVLMIESQATAGPVYVSGLLDTRGKRELKYGRIEIDAKMPATLGAAPSLWMLPATDEYGPWPQSGEIDIANAPDIGVGGNIMVEHTLKYGLPQPENTATTGAFNAPSAPDAGFLTYAVEWEAGEIRWFVGDVHVLTQSQDNWYSYSEDAQGVYMQGTADAPFNEDFYLILNLAVANSADGSSTFPQTLEVDAVRVYECANALDPQAGSGCSRGDSSVMPVVALDAPYNETVAVYTDALALLDFVDENMMTTNSQLVATTVTSDGSVTVSSTLNAVDPDGGNFWNLDIAAATGAADLLVHPGDFPGFDAFINLSGAATAGEILFRMRVNSVTGTPDITIGLESANGGGAVSLPYSADGQWQPMSVKISDVVTNAVEGGAGLDLTAIINLFKLTASTGSINLDIDDIEIKVACRDNGGCEASPSLVEIPVVVRYSQNFDALDIGASSVGDGWLYFVNVFNGSSYLFGYGPGPAPNGPQMSALVSDQGDTGTQQLSVYSDYECCAGNVGHSNPTNVIETNIFKEFTLIAADVGKTMKFSFDVKRGNINDPASDNCINSPNPPCDSTAVGFIKVINPNSGFSTTLFKTVVLTDSTEIWTQISIEQLVGNWEGQLFQIGFFSTSDNYEPSGMFYDNVVLTETGP